jgi:hypothetical protein
MKTSTLSILISAVFGCTQLQAQKLEFKEHISREFPVLEASKMVLAIYNMNGPLRIEGYNGNKVLLEADKTITAKEQKDLDEGKVEFQMKADQNADSIIVYLAEPFDTRPKSDIREWDTRKKIMYQHSLAFVVKVPYALNIRISTINGGGIQVDDVRGKLSLYNVNGAVKVANAQGLAEIRTVNGNLDASFAQLPAGAMSFKTINGNITLTCPTTLAADCEYKSFSGGFYTDFPETATLPSKVIKNDSEEKEKTTYKRSSQPAVRIGKGGQNKIKFETMNGNIYVKKQS